MLVPSTVLQRIVGDYDTISREVGKRGRNREGKKEREKDGGRQRERDSPSGSSATLLLLTLSEVSFFILQRDGVKVTILFPETSSEDSDGSSDTTMK